MSGILSAFSGGSYGSPPSNTVAPVVSGTATFGQTLSSTTGTWTGVPTPTFAYQWYRSPSTVISGATSSTYTLVSGDVGNTIYCKVTATNAISSISANSNTTATVSAIAPSAPTIGTATTVNCSSATVAFTAPSCTGGASITLYQATCVATGTKTGTGASSPVTVSGLSPSSTYQFKVRAQNSIGYGSYSGNSNSITTSAPPYMCISTSGATVTTCGNYKIATWNATGSFTVNRLGSSSGYGDHINVWAVGGGGGATYYAGGGAGAAVPSNGAAVGCLASSGIAVTARSYTATVGLGGAFSGCALGGTGTISRIETCGSTFGSTNSPGGGGATTSHGGAGGNYGIATNYTCSINRYCKSGVALSGGGGGGTAGPGGTPFNAAPSLSYTSNSCYLGSGCGGAGYSTTFPGSSGVTLYAGGGGGGGFGSSGSYGTSFRFNPTGKGLGGSNGGGQGAISSVANACSGAVARCSTAGTTNRGGGGGAGAAGSPIRVGANGGSGIVIVRWRFQ